MKKYIAIISTCFLLFSCFGSNPNNPDLQNAKEELLGNKIGTSSSVSSNTGAIDASIGAEDIQTGDVEGGNIQEEKGLLITSLTDIQFLEFDNMTQEDFKNLEYKITGRTLANVDKITVHFSNPTSTLPNSSYTLTKFKPGDKTFLYNAFKKYGSIAYGENTYVFEAFSGELVSKLELKVYVLDPSQSDASHKPIDIENLPTSTTFGTPQSLGDGKITYSDIKGLEIQEVGNISLKNDSDSITNYLTDTTQGWFYWNTPRYINDDKGLSFYVIKKETNSNEYTYSKHYYNGNGIYGVLVLEKGKLREDETVKEKNTELAVKNDTFPMTKIADQLFVDLTK